jgi:predicted Rossmann-fold nucleotide-binding protein
MGTEYWQTLCLQLERMKQEGTVSAADFDHLFITDDPESALAFIRKHAIDEYGLSRKMPPKPIGIYGERKWSQW